MITVLFATHNGEDTLPIMLDSFNKLIMPKEGVEIIAVNNASTDNTVNILEKYSKILPLTIVHENIKGKNNALNKGLSISSGRYIIFTDDDIIPESTWLSTMVTCMDSKKEYGIFGGTILPRWPKKGAAPSFIEEIPAPTVYAITQGATWNHSGPIEANKIFGANMAVRKSIFDTGIRFDGKVGPKGTQYIMGSETTFIETASRQLGVQCFFCADARVEHIIRPEQLQPGWLKKRAFLSGRGTAYKSITELGSAEKTILNVPLWTYRVLIKYFVKELLNKFGKGSISIAWKYHFYRGYAYQYRLMTSDKS